MTTKESGPWEIHLLQSATLYALFHAYLHDMTHTAEWNNYCEDQQVMIPAQGKLESTTAVEVPIRALME